LEKPARGERSSIPAYAKLKCPALIIFGKHDDTVPVEESVARIEKILKETGNQDYTLKVFENGAHGILEVDEKNPSQLVTPARMIPGYYDFLWGWLEKVLQRS
jgi:dipeptidyl aminopeptidase/acylaminoacyl peptidase